MKNRYRYVPSARDVAIGVGAHLARKYIPLATDYAVRKAWQYGSKLVGTSNRDARRPMAGTPLQTAPYNRPRLAPKGPGRTAPRTIGGRRANNKRARPARPGRSGGFLKTRKYKSNPESVSGVNYTGEFGGSASNTNMVVIGHATSPPTITYKQMWIAVLKRLFKQADFLVLDTGLVFPFGGKIVVTFKTQPDAGLTTDTCVMAGGTTTLQDLAGYYIDAARTWNQNFATRTNALEMLTMAWFPLRDPVPDAYSYVKTSLVRLDEIVVKIAAKSSFKIQNRSTHVADAHNADTVDQVPLYGKSYEGASTGTYWVNQMAVTAPFVAGRLDGVIRPIPPAAMKEPPKPAEFKGTQKMGKARIEPGYIKTSVLYHTASHTPSIWCRMLGPSVWNTYTTPQVGRYRFFCLEKILDSDEADPLTCAYEHNLAITSSTYSFRKNPTIQMFESQRNLVAV